MVGGFSALSGKGWTQSPSPPQEAANEQLAEGFPTCKLWRPSGDNQEDIKRGEKVSAAFTDYHSGHEHEAHSTNGLGNESRIENRGEYCRVHGTCPSDVLAWKKAVDALDRRDFASALKHSKEIHDDQGGNATLLKRLRAVALQLQHMEGLHQLESNSLHWALRVLKATANSSPADIQKQYRALALLFVRARPREVSRVHHPDKNQDNQCLQRCANEAFTSIQRAWETVREQMHIDTDVRRASGRTSQAEYSTEDCEKQWWQEECASARGRTMPGGDNKAQFDLSSISNADLKAQLGQLQRELMEQLGNQDAAAAKHTRLQTTRVRTELTRRRNLPDSTTFDPLESGGFSQSAFKTAQVPPWDPGYQAQEAPISFSDDECSSNKASRKRKQAVDKDAGF